MSKLKIALYIFLFLGGVSLITAPILLYKKWQSEKSERERIERNWYATVDEMKTYETKSGWHAQEMAAQEIKYKELEKINSGLANDVSELKVKLKNTKSITKIETKIEYRNKDSIVYVPVGEGRRKFDLSDKDNWFKAEVIVTDCNHIKADDFKLETRDSTLIVPDIKYKGWWFWKKVDKVRITVANKNPYATNNVQHYDIIK